MTSSLTQDQPVLHANGQRVEAGASVAFDPGVATDTPSDAGATVDTVLLSVASRPSMLDSAAEPKVLMKLAGAPVIGHVLVQLAAAGVRRAVLVLGARGRLIRDVILSLPVARKLALEFVDLGETFSGGFARSLQEARKAVCAGLPDGKPFLLCTADHIFDSVLIRTLAHRALAHCVLAHCALAHCAMAHRALVWHDQSALAFGVVRHASPMLAIANPRRHSSWSSPSLSVALPSVAPLF